MKGYRVFYQTYHNEFRDKKYVWYNPQELYSLNPKQALGISDWDAYARDVMKNLSIKQPERLHNNDKVEIVRYTINPYSEEWETPQVVGKFEYQKGENL